MGLLYEQCPWLRLRLSVLLKSPITFALLHYGLVIFPILPILSLHPYGDAAPSFLIQCSSRCLRKGVLNVGLLVWWYIFSIIMTLIDIMEWSGEFKCYTAVADLQTYDPTCVYLKIPLFPLCKWAHITHNTWSINESSKIFCRDTWQFFYL
jgi:hypothetical protein